MSKSNYSSKPSQQSEVLEEDRQAIQSAEPPKRTEKREAGRKKRDYEALIGLKFNKLTIVEVARFYGKRTQATCTCECGERWVGSIEWVVSGNTKSCGCYKWDTLKKLNTTHGLTKHPFYGRWQDMIQRCHSKTDSAFRNYGARGISVCDRWRLGENGEHPFVLFLRDVFPAPFEGASIDRINNSLDYSPDNCRWANHYQQSGNRRNIAWVHLPMTSLPLGVFCRIYGKHRSTIIRRMRRLNISLTEAATLP